MLRRSNADPPGIGRSLAEVLLRLLAVDFVYVRFVGPAGAVRGEAVQTRHRAEPPVREIGWALGPKHAILSGQPQIG